MIKIIIIVILKMYSKLDLLRRDAAYMSFNKLQLIHYNSHVFIHMVHPGWNVFPALIEEKI